MVTTYEVGLEQDKTDKIAAVAAESNRCMRPRRKSRSTFFIAARAP